ncbi:MAG: HlyD family efflux transporter periplasmic adaptor subunit, partial [Candidatus Aegiribacteria sp.]|nr:HlyD family efflux transporter periplasmic adaptor subunit [Candidatus Aegiribacteria sp.]MBD3294872.1 HlyD family efflux transporter periplasmic adaptor subunit [Candidatus Fermentibacteria bacterium]
MRNLKNYSKVQVWIAGCLIGVLAGALIPGNLLFRSGEELHDHAAEQSEGQNWACPMLCVVLDSPGTCPVCGMELEPFQASGTEVVLNRHDQEMIGLSIDYVRPRELTSSFSATGTIEFDETGNYTVTAWTAGRIENLYVESEGLRVSGGEILMSIYSPELYTAQQELLVLADGSNPLGDAGISAVREKLRLLGASDYQIDRLLETGRATSTFSVGSPASGTVTEVFVTEGQHVMRGQKLFSITDLSRVWLTAHLTEDQLGRVAPGQQVVFTLDGSAGLQGSGVVETVVPFMNMPGGSAEVRIPLDNLSNTLYPEQTAAVTFLGSESDPVLSIPRSSVLRLGDRALAYFLTAPTVYAVNDDNTLSIEEVRFEPR